MDSKNKILVIAVVAALIVGSWGILLFTGLKGGDADGFAQGAPGGRYLEQYVPVVRYNGGMATALPFDMDGTSAILTVGGTFSLTGAATLSNTLTVTGDVTVDSTDFFIDVSLDRVGFGTSSPIHDFVVEGVATSTFTGDGATTTVFVNSNTALFGSQIILENPDGLVCSNIVLDAAGTALVVAVITCPSEAEI